MKWWTSGTAFARFYIIPTDVPVPRYETTAVIIDKLANAITANLYCLKWCRSGTTFVSFSIITKDVPVHRYERTAVIM